ncbi:hypothetical protein BC834DRAFT_35541 [Gloeopeniophorella convolvens]|nr:hypothetical protein BC834DRAFT_35541 [Gloeopeniophorella convolvens]
MLGCLRRAWREQDIVILASGQHLLPMLSRLHFARPSHSSLGGPRVYNPVVPDLTILKSRPFRPSKCQMPGPGGFTCQADLCVQSAGRTRVTIHAKFKNNLTSGTNPVFTPTLQEPDHRPLESLFEASAEVRQVWLHRNLHSLDSSIATSRGPNPTRIAFRYVPIRDQRYLFRMASCSARPGCGTITLLLRFTITKYLHELQSTGRLLSDRSFVRLHMWRLYEP